MSRHPSTPGIPGQRLPTPDSVPPEERIMRELASLEGRMLGRFADQHAEAKIERQDIRDQLGTLRDQITALTNAVLAGRTIDVEQAGQLGELRALSRTEGGSAGGKRGIIAAIGTVLAAIGGKWLAQKLGLDL